MNASRHAFVQYSWCIAEFFGMLVTGGFRLQHFWKHCFCNSLQ
ncbi:hypothetical protein [Corallococcus sp. M7]